MFYVNVGNINTIRVQGNDFACLYINAHIGISKSRFTVVGM